MDKEQEILKDLGIDPKDTVAILKDILSVGAELKQAMSFLHNYADHEGFRLERAFTENKDKVLEIAIRCEDTLLFKKTGQMRERFAKKFEADTPPERRFVAATTHFMRMVIASGGSGIFITSAVIVGVPLVAKYMKQNHLH